MEGEKSSKGISNIINKYSDTWRTLLLYDENKLETKDEDNNLFSLSFKEVDFSIKELKKELENKGELTRFFGVGGCL